MTGYGAGQGAQRGGLLSVILMPLLLIVLVLGLLIYNLVGTIGILSRGGEFVYVEETFKTHLNGVYNAGVKDVKATDSALAIIFLYDVDKNTMSYEVKAGSNLMNEVTDLFGVDKDFGKLLNDNKVVSRTDYSKTFAEDLGKVMNKMATKINELNLNNVFVRKYESDTTFPDAMLRTDEKVSMSLDNSDALKSALAEFTAETGVPVIVSVGTYEGLFGRTIPWTGILFDVLLLAVAAYLIFNLIKKIRAYKRIEADFATQPQVQQPVRSPYYDDEEDEEESDEEYEYEDEEEVDEAMEEIDEAMEEDDESLDK